MNVLRLIIDYSTKVLVSRIFILMFLKKYSLRLIKAVEYYCGISSQFK